MAKALYRKYRPCHLSDVIGQEQVTNTLARSLEQNKVSHAYLFVGPRGTGKTSVARIFAHEINQFKYEIEDDYVDIIEVDGASNRGIDDIRELREKALVAPTSGKYKIYIIDEVHMLTREAFNALLKTLEEPPAHVIFIMATTEINKVPVTITSRSQIFTFKLAETDVMFKYLSSIAKKEKIKIDDDALKIIVKRGGGSFRDSLSLLDQISTLSSDKITNDTIISALGLPSDEKIATLLAEYQNGDVVKITTILKDLLSSGIKAELLAEEMINSIIANPTPELLLLLEKLPTVTAPFPEAKLLVALSSRIASASDPGSSRSAKNEARETVSQTTYKLSEKSEPRDDGRKRTKNELRSSATFDINKFVSDIKSINETVYLQLKKSELVHEQKVLHIYPNTKIAKTILTAKNNKAILENHANGLHIEIHELSEKPKNQVKDQKIDQISDIMGGEVINYGGENPF